MNAINSRKVSSSQGGQRTSIRRARCATRPWAWQRCGTKAAPAPNRSIARPFKPIPADPNVLAEMALLHIYSGNLDKAFSLLDEAERLNPLPPLWYAEFRGIAAFVMRRYADALPAFAAVPECVFDTTYVMACLGHMDDRKRTALVMQRVRERNWNLVPVAEDEPFRDPQPRLDLIAGVRKALDFGL